MPPRTLDLRDKRNPSDELPAGVDRQWHLLYTNSHNKQSCLLAGSKLRERMTALMSDPNANGLGDLPEKLSDCGLRRAFHDELGVRKVVFTFCDDILSSVYKLESNWTLFEKELLALFSVLGVNSNRVVRCLLAELNTQVTIPVHHDTGYWATRSHRVHVPLITHETVEFYTGKTRETLQRVKFPEFEAIELNNRAKHMVVNKWSKPRVHLIFDFVEDHEYIPHWRTLQPHDVVYQTRRTISINQPVAVEATTTPAVEESDRAIVSKQLMARIPPLHTKEFIKLSKRFSDGEMLVAEYARFLIRLLPVLEFSRATEEIISLLQDRERAHSLQVYLSQEVGSTVVTSTPSTEKKKKEPMFFVIAGAMKCGTTSLFEYINQHPSCVRARQKEPHAFDWVWNQLQQVPGKSLEEKYALAFPTVPANSFTGEATPSYMLGGTEVLSRLKAATVNKDVRVVVILRDPVERAWSHFNMIRNTQGDADQLKRRGSIQNKSFRQVVDEDLAALKQCQIGSETLSSDFETCYLSSLPSGHGAHSFVGRGLYSLQLEAVFQQFPHNNVLILQLEKVEQNLQQEMDKVFAFLGVDTVKVQPQRFNAAPRVEAKSAEDEAVLAQLREYYRPHNARLSHLVPHVCYE